MKLLATGRSIQLIDGDQLIVSGVNSTLLEIASDELGFKIIFQGTIKEIKAGPSGFEQNLMPRSLSENRLIYCGPA